MDCLNWIELSIMNHIALLFHQVLFLQILLTDDGPRHTFSRVFDLEMNDMAAEGAETRTSPFESRFPINIGITGQVASTGVVNRNNFS